MNKEIEQLINEFAKKRYQEGYDDGYKDRPDLSETKTEAYYWDGPRDAYAYVLNILKNFLKKIEKS